MSQQELGRQIGVTFQQVQKYERGVNRIGAGRLTQIANTLGVDIPVLFEGVSRVPGGRRSTRPFSELLSERRAYRLAQAFANIEDTRLRNCLVELVERIAGHRK